MIIQEELLQQLSGCKPYAHFILRVMMVKACDQPPQSGWQIEGLREELGMKEETLRKHLSTLTKCGVLERCSQKTAARGRPRLSYRLSALVLSQVQSQPETKHGELLRRLFSGEVMSLADLVSQRRHRVLRAKGDPLSVGDVVTQRLSTESRLLFACLLSKADQFGVVQIGKAGLACTGMSKPALKAGIRRLKLLGLIRQQVSGTASDIFKKGKVSSTYFLNLGALGGRQRVAIGVYEGVNDRPFGHRIFNDAMRTFERKSRPWGTPYHFAWCLSRQSRVDLSRLAMIFQLELLGFAAGMLGRHWEGLDLIDVDARVFDGELGLIRARFSNILSTLGQGSEDEFQTLCKFFCTHAVELARTLRLHFGKTGWIGGSRDFCILPTLPEFGTLERKVLTLMWCPCPENWENVAFFRSDLPDLEDTRIPESDMRMDKRYEAGLIAYRLAMQGL